MKNIYSSWSLEALADRMINEIQKEWKNPFSSPAVVFTDAKLEQWFKLYWLKKNDSDKCVLMSLKTMRLQNFLFEIAETPAVSNAEKLSVELLRDVIISNLSSQKLEDEDVNRYITNKVKLYDFAQESASLFMDYEETRPDSLNQLFEKSKWQKELYSKVQDICINDRRYLTLLQIYRENRKSGKFNWPQERPVYLFGFSGIGQLYRKILSDFAETNSLSVFLQTGKKSENFQNPFLKEWAMFGQECLKLWTEKKGDNDECRITEISTKTSEDSLLHRVQKSILEDSPFVQESFNQQEESLTLSSAPTRLREIENVHSQICRLLKEGKASVGDVLVVSQNIQDYKIAIEQVFDQTDRHDSEFPYLPYIIADYSAENSFTAEAVRLLFSILKKGYFTRADFFALLRNSLVQQVRSLDDEEISSWVDWASSLNIYRDRKSDSKTIEDWKKAKTRLLLARLSDDLVITKEENQEKAFEPYETIDTQDDEKLYHFVEAIDELEEWISLSQKDKRDELSISEIEKIHAFLDRWLLLEGTIPPNMITETFIYQNITEEIERQIMTAKEKVFTDCFIFALLDRAHATSLHQSGILANGITFANFESNRVLSAKYVFFIGLDSKSFPGKDSQNELDLRDKEEGDESVPAKNKNAFLCQLMAAQEGFFISYINKNLRKDEDFYISSLAAQLFNTVYGKTENGSALYERRISIDENRKWEELFTQRAFRNKNNFIKMQGLKNSEEDSEEDSADENADTEHPDSSVPQKQILPDQVNISSIRKYLKDPFQYMAGIVFTSGDDEESAEIEEYEPITFDKVTKAGIKKNFIKEILSSPDINDLRFLEGAALEEKVSECLKKVKSEIKREQKNNNRLPDSYFGDEAFNEITKECLEIFNKIIKQNLTLDNLNFSKNINLTIGNWKLKGSAVWYNSDFTEADSQGKRNLFTLEIKKSEDCLAGYISALALIAELPQSDENEYNISLYTFGSTKAIPPAEFTLNRKEALEILNKIYYSMFVEKYYTCIPYTFLNNPKIQNLHDFLTQLSSPFGGVWLYFSKKDYFDLPSDLKYTEDNFLNEFEEAKAHQLSLIKCIEVNDEE
ncbi:MAG: exodeoxyribonuclease V subunit gamma [Treponema sp.]|nr:exodeoxyribonuclease V subunit gamma [Treponema sp.]